MRRLTEWFNSKVKVLLLAGLLPAAAYAQQPTALSLGQAQELARQRYPVTRQLDLLRQTAQYTLENLNKGYFPHLAINGQATYQSDVTQVPISLPNMEIPAPAKDQYKVTADVTQVLYDGNLIGQQKKVAQLSTAVENQRVEMELYKLRERINQLFLGTLLLDQQLEQVYVLQQDLETGIRKVEAQVNNGVSFKSGLYLLQAELLKHNQRRAELQALRRGTLQALGLFLGLAPGQEVKLLVPVPAAGAPQAGLQRPELKLYASQQALLAQQKKLLQARNLPKASLFWQSGYGRPGLNFLQNETDWWYLGGLRLNWAIGNYYSYRNDKNLIAVNQQLTQVQQETFLLHTQAQLVQQQAEIDKLQQLLAADREILALREKVKASAKAQLENGVMTAPDYLREVNAEDQARQVLVLHQLQLLQAQITYSTLLGY